MSNPYQSFCDDFYVNMRLGSQLPLPNGRETVLHFLESVQKQFPSMTRFRRNDAGELNLEEERGNGSYRWAAIEAKRLAAGHVNPPSIADALKLHEFLLDLSPYHLGISPLEIDYLDVLFGFDLGFTGNHDEIISESLLSGCPLACIGEETGARAVDVQPSITFALNDDCRLQARLDLITRTNSYQVRTGDYSDESISVYMIIRRYWGDRPKEPMAKLLADMAERAEDLCDRYVLPRVIKPLSQAISSRS